ncbi:MAG TPA: response regulator [bacterium]|nr:response regulator [bacterium]
MANDKTLEGSEKQENHYAAHRAAVEAFESAIESGEPYDIVFLDIEMPEMNGQEALLKMREIEEDKDIMELDETAIIMATSLSDSKNITDAIHGGEATSYIVKPVTEEKITGKLGSLGLITIDDNEDYVYRASFLNAGDYTIAFTCQADGDDPELSDPIAFVGTKEVSVTAGVVTIHNFQ